MPNLPTLNVTNQAAYDRIVSAFQGATQAETVANYKAWLREAVKTEVIRKETGVILAQAENDVQTIQAQLDKITDSGT